MYKSFFFLDNYRPRTKEKETTQKLDGEYKLPLHQQTKKHNDLLHDRHDTP